MSNKQSVNKAAQREPVEVVYGAELDKLRGLIMVRCHPAG